MRSAGATNSPIFNNVWPSLCKCYNEGQTKEANVINICIPLQCSGSTLCSLFKVSDCNDMLLELTAVVGF